jgi:hypothetical protein
MKFTYLSKTLRQLSHDPDSLFSSEMKYSAMYLDYEYVYGIKPTWEMAEEALKLLSPRHLTNALSYISTELSKFAHFSKDGGLSSAKLINLFFPKNKDLVFSSIESMKSKLLINHVVVFSESQVVNAMKLVAKHCDQNVISPPDNLQAIGDVFLLLNDLAENIRNPDGSSNYNVFIRMLFCNLTYHRSGQLANGLTRNYHLFLSDNPELKEDPDYINLPNSAREVLGCDPEVFWAMQFGVFSRIMAFEKDIPNGWDLGFSYDILFKDFNFTENELLAIKRLTTQNFSDLKTKVSHQSIEGIPFNVFPVAELPVIDFGDISFCPSRTSFEDKLKLGAYHIHLQRTIPDERKRRFHRYFGKVFSAYVMKILRSAYGDIVIELDSGFLSGPTSPPHCDIVLNYGDSVILIEIKSKMLSVGARSGENAQMFDSAIEDIYVKPCYQINSTALMIENGKLLSYGLDPKKINYYHSLIIGFDSTPTIGVLYEYLMGRIHNRTGFPAFKKQSPIQFMGCDEIEYLKSAQDRGISLLMMIETKLQTNMSTNSFNNFWDEAGIKFSSDDSSIMEFYESVSLRAVEVMMARRK